MLIDFKFSNYRSYKNEAKFSLIAESARSKSSNLCEIENDKGQVFKLSKASVIYGPNASGKSNLIKALIDVISFILNRPSVNEPIKIYRPFLFNIETQEKKSSFELTFLGPERNKYILTFSIFRNMVAEEKLEYYPKNRLVTLYHRREDINREVQIEEEKSIVDYDGKSISIFKNQLFLSRFGEEPDDKLTPIFQYFRSTFSTSLQIAGGPRGTSLSRTSELLLENPVLKQQVSNLLKAIDTKINGIKIDDIKDEIEDLFPKDMVKSNLSSFRYVVHSEHDLYDGDVLLDKPAHLQFTHESQGTQTIFSLGAKIFDAINNGKVLIVDELDTSLHPHVTRFLVMLFLSNSNSKGAQLIFSTHDISLLEKDLFRRDQIWFTEKNDKGNSDLFCLQDFEGLREDIPFEKWYMAGKFGALPTIGHIESVFKL